MSGPKVVRIVTREELEAICRQHIAQLDEAIDAVRGIAARLGRLDDNLQTELARQRQVLAQHYAAEQWAAVQKRAPELAAGLRSHADRLRSEAAAATAAARSRNRRLAEGARSLVDALEARHQPVDPALREAITQALGASDEQLAAIEGPLNRALSQLRLQPDPPTGNADQRAFADRLAAGTQELSLAAWLAANSPLHNRDVRLDALLAELEARGEMRTLHEFTARAAQIVRDPDEHRRALLTDSLILDAGQSLAEQQSIERAAARLRDARARLASVAGEAANGLAGQITAALEAGNFRHTEQLCTAAHDLAERGLKTVAVLARRRAVLDGLAALGYEVRADMATAWAQDGRVVLRKPGSSDYGVELGATPDLDRMQIRLVGADQPDQPRSAGRDRDQEVVWCGEFGNLQANLAAQGSDLVIERALEPGAQAVKTVAMPGSDVTSGADTITPKQIYKQ